VCGEDVAQVGAVEDVLEGRQNADPDSGAVVAGNISARTKSALLLSEVWLPLVPSWATSQDSESWRRARG
jgi:hypothetical protein